LIVSLRSRAAPPAVSAVTAPAIETPKPAPAGRPRPTGPVLRFGQVLYLNDVDMRRDTEPLRKYLENHLARPVDIVPIPYDAGSIAEALREGQVDIAHLPPLAYVRARDKVAGVIPLATVTIDGMKVYNGALVTRADTKTTDLKA